jgi:hypothetical protein
MLFHSKRLGFSNHSCLIDVALVVFKAKGVTSLVVKVVELLFDFTKTSLFVLLEVALDFG